MSAVRNILKPLQNIWKYVSKLKKYLLLVLLPLLCGVVLLVVVWNITRGQINEYGNLTTQYFKSEVTAMFHEAEYACNYLVKDRLFEEYMNAETPWDFDRGQFCESIQKYTGESVYISDIFVCNSNQKIIYSSKAYWEYTPYTAIIKSAQLPSILHDGVKTGWHVLNTDDAVPYYIAQVPLGQGKEDIFVIVTLEIYPLLQFMHSIDAQGCALFNEEGFITPLITNRTDINWGDADSISELLGVRVECFYGEENNYTYMVAVAQKEFNMPLRFIALIFGLYFAVVAVVGFIYLYVAASRDHKRMAAIIDYLPAENAGGPTEEELFSNVRISLRQYQNDKKKFEDENRSNAVRQILKRGQNKAIHDDKYMAAGIPLDASGYCVVSLFTDDYSDMFFDDGDELQNIDIARIIFRTVLDEIAAGRIRISGTGLGRIYASVFSFSDQKEPMRLVYAVVRDTVDFIEENYGLNLCAAISDPVQDSGRIHEAYQETERLKDYAKVVGIDSGIISTQNLADATEDAFDGNYITQLQILTNAIHAEKFDLIPQLVEQILNRYVTVLRKHYHIVQSRVTTMSGLLSEAVLSCKISDVDLVALSQRFRDVQTVADLNTAVQEVFFILNRRVEENSEEDPINRACEYIRANSGNPNLSIPAISEYSGISLRHLTRLFQQKLGCTVAAYLHSYRIVCSKKILAETTLSVSSVAQKVGYNSTNTFVYNFRHYEGITPASYRKLALRRDGEENI